MKKIRPVQIEQVANGYIVTVGCQRLVFASADGLVATLVNYTRDPEGLEKTFAEKFGFDLSPRADSTPPMGARQEPYLTTEAGNVGIFSTR